MGKSLLSANEHLYEIKMVQALLLSDMNKNQKGELMNKLVLASLVVLSSMNAMAAARDFRINRDAIASGGYAVAWGIPGEKIDFESFEADEKQVNEFIDSKTDKVRNYLVDLESEKILLDITDSDDGMVDFRLGNYHVGNHYNISVQRLEIASLPGYNSEAIAVIENNKWANYLSHVVIVDRDQNQKVVLNATDLDVKIKAEITKKLSKKEKDMYEAGAVNISLQSTFLEKVGVVNVVSLDSDIPKSDKPGIEIKAYVTLAYKNGSIEVKVLSQRSKIR